MKNGRLFVILSLLSAAFLLSAAGRTEVAPGAGEGLSAADRANEPRGFMGFRKKYEEKEGQGRFRVHSVVPGSPAEKSGLKPDDVIVAFNGVGFRFSNEVEQYEAFGWMRPGNQVELTVLRGGAQLELELIAGKMPADVAHQIAEILSMSHYSQQSETLHHLGRGDGVEITVSRYASTGGLEFTAEGYAPRLFAHMELFLARVPTMSDFLAKLERGDRFKLLIRSDGENLNMHILEPPPYLKGYSP